ncbi:MAG TPA: hypothetical protein VJI68_01120 [Candidatus Nanoarchaeia archaeon]|nr:hypothetical protein [Candidatus Nanoarchaeia archaeon]
MGRFGLDELNSSTLSSLISARNKLALNSRVRDSGLVDVTDHTFIFPHPRILVVGDNIVQAYSVHYSPKRADLSSFFNSLIYSNGCDDFVDLKGNEVELASIFLRYRNSFLGDYAFFDDVESLDGQDHRSAFLDHLQNRYGALQLVADPRESAFYEERGFSDTGFRLCDLDIESLTSKERKQVLYYQRALMHWEK